MVTNVISELVVKISPELDRKKSRRFRQDQNQTQKTLEDLTSGLKGVANAFKSFVAVKAVQQASEFIYDLAKSFNQLRSASLNSGNTVKDLERIRQAFNKTALGGDAAVSSLRSFSAFLQEKHPFLVGAKANFVGFQVDPNASRSENFLTAVQQGAALLQKQRVSQGEEKAALEQKLKVLADLGVSREVIEAYLNDSNKVIKSLEYTATLDTGIYKEISEESSKIVESWDTLTQSMKNDLLPALLNVLKISSSITETLAKSYQNYSSGKSFIKKSDIRSSLYRLSGGLFFKNNEEKALDNLPSVPESNTETKRGKIGASIAKDLIALGLPKTTAIGFAANAVRESGGNANAQVIDTNKRLSTGLFQFNHPSYFEEYKNLYGKDLRFANKIEQLRYIAQSKHPDIVKARNASANPNISVGQAAQIVTRDFEKPQDIRGQSAESAKIANEINITINASGMNEKKIAEETAKQINKINQADQSRLVQGLR